MDPFGTRSGTPPWHAPQVIGTLSGKSRDSRSLALNTSWTPWQSTHVAARCTFDPGARGFPCTPFAKTFADSSWHSAQPIVVADLACGYASKSEWQSAHSLPVCAERVDFSKSTRCPPAFEASPWHARHLASAADGGAGFFGSATFGGSAGILSGAGAAGGASSARASADANETSTAAPRPTSQPRRRSADDMHDPPLRRRGAMSWRARPNGTECVLDRRSGRRRGRTPRRCSPDAQDDSIYCNRRAT